MIESKTYPNGLKLVVETNPSSPSTGCLFHFDVATLNEKKGEQGYAHFLEHMLAGGSTNKRSMKEISDVYSTCGVEVDASTGIDNTEYKFISLNEDFDKCFEAMCESLFDNAFLASECERERKVIMQEHGDEDIFCGLQDRLIDFHYNGEYVKYIEGDKQSIQNVDLEKLKAFYKREYIPNNLTISICGNKTFEQIETLINNNIFNRLDREAVFLKAPQKQISVPKKICILKNKSFDIQSEVLLMFPANIKTIASSVFITSLQSFCGRLYEKLRLEEPLVYEVSIYSEPSINSLILYFACSHNNVPTCLRKIRGVFEDISKNGLTQKELVSAKAKLQLSIVLCKDDVDFRMGFNALKSEKGMIQTVEEFFQDYKNVSNEEVKEFAKSLLESKYAIGEQGKYASCEALYAFDPALAPKKTPKKPKYVSKFSKLLGLKKTEEQDQEIDESQPKEQKNDKKTREK